MGRGARAGAMGHLLACSKGLSRLSPPAASLQSLARPIDMIILLNFSNLKNNEPARARRGMLQTPGSLRVG